MSCQESHTSVNQISENRSVMINHVAHLVTVNLLVSHEWSHWWVMMRSVLLSPHTWSAVVIELLMDLSILSDLTDLYCSMNGTHTHTHSLSLSLSLSLCVCVFVIVPVVIVSFLLFTKLDFNILTFEWRSDYNTAQLQVVGSNLVRVISPLLAP